MKHEASPDAGRETERRPSELAGECPECGAALRRTGGCRLCRACGYSPCA